MEAFIERKSKSKEVVKLRVGVEGGQGEEELYTMLTKGDKLWRNDKIKAKGFEILGEVDYGRKMYER